MTQVTQTELMKRAFFELMKGVNTAIPGHIIAFDPASQSAQIQTGVLKVKVGGEEFTPPPLITVPVYFCGGQNFSIEYQIDPGDEGLVIFSQRCIDGWKTTGGVAKNPILRFHDQGDALFLPGIRSRPKALPSFSNNGIRLRNDDGSHYVWLKNDGEIIMNNGSGYIKLQQDGTVDINGVTITPGSELYSPNSIEAVQSLVVAGAEVKEHDHDKGTYKDAENRPLLSGDSGKLS